MSDLNDILANSGEHIPEEKLVAYLEGKLSAEEQHEVELWLADNGMESDALDGLKNLPVPETKDIVTRLNHNLHTTLQKKSRRKAGKLKDNNWSWIAVIIILLLCIAAYIVLHYSMPK